MEKRQQKAIVDEEIRQLKARIEALEPHAPEIVATAFGKPSIVKGSTRNHSNVTQRGEDRYTEQQIRLNMAKHVGRRLGIGHDILRAQARLPPVLTAVAPDLWNNRVLRADNNGQSSQPDAKANRAMFSDCVRRAPHAPESGWARSCTTGRLRGVCLSPTPTHHTHPQFGQPLRSPINRTLETGMACRAEDNRVFNQPAVLTPISPPTSKVLNCAPLIPCYTPGIKTKRNCLHVETKPMPVDTAPDNNASASSSGLPRLTTGTSAILRDCAFLMMPLALPAL